MKLNYILNEHYFDNIDCDEKAYWLGLLFADGSISNTSNTIVFGQIEDRLDLVNKFKDTICLTKDIKVKYPKIGKPFYFCEFTSKHMCKKLKEYGCIPQKSLLLKFNPNIIPNQYIYAFIRGYFDGDGCIWNGKRRIMLVKILIVNLVKEKESYIM